MKTIHPNHPERPREGAPEPDRDADDRAPQSPVREPARCTERYRRRLRRMTADQFVDGGGAASAW